VLAHCLHINRLSVHDAFDFDLMKVLKSLINIEITDYSGELDVIPIKDSVVTLKLERLNSLKNLDMLRSFPHLRRLEITESPSIEDFAGIGRCKELRELKIEAEYGVEDVGFLVGLNELRKIDVSECLALADVKAINSLPKLSSVTLPFAALYDQLNRRLIKDVALLDRDTIEVLDEDAEDYL